MTGFDTIVTGGDRVRVGPFRGSAQTGSIVPLANSGAVHDEAVAQGLATLRSRGFDHVVTSAMGPIESRPFHAAGFRIHHELHLLIRDLESHPAPAPDGRIRLRAARRTDWNQVLEIDRAAFDSFWQFDSDSIRDALKATPSRRFQVVKANPPTGYHITGRAGPNGYLQRLAVDPAAHRQGLGRLLLHDSLAWLQRRNVDRVFVNTQLDNDAAYSLYRAEHFAVAEHRLAVLELDLR